MLLLNSSSSGPDFVINLCLKLHLWPKILELAFVYMPLLSFKLFWIWLKAHKWVLQAHILLLLKRFPHQRFQAISVGLAGFRLIWMAATTLKSNAQSGFVYTDAFRVGGADQPSIPSVMPPRPVRNNADIPRSGSYVHPFLPGQSSVAARAPGSVGSSMIPPHPGSAARARERAQALQAYFQQPCSLLGLRTPIVSGSRRSNSQAQMGQAGSSSDNIRGDDFTSMIWDLGTKGTQMSLKAPELLERHSLVRNVLRTQV
ncbi:hypothetical protein HanIR_Chr09g0401251 [Helianthus annuus]|nr:hypothetical protein HanIR_Chr09g0401251 [Helianthus annuus]